MARKTSLKSEAAYVDTAAFISFLDKSDSYHLLFSQLFANPPKLLTSSLVIAEGHGWFLKRFDQYRALEFLNFISAVDTLSVLQIGQTEINDGAKLLRKFSDQRMTLVDGVGLALMDQHKINCCWSTDRHMGLTRKRLVINSNI